MSKLDKVYTLATPDDAQGFYDDWASRYEAELVQAGYVTPERCAEALAAHATEPGAPLADFGCGTGLSGVALGAAGFTCIDGYDISPGMLAEARAKGVYRSLAELDLSGPLDAVPDDTYRNAAAIGVLNPSFMPATVVDEMLSKLPSGGCVVLSINDKSGEDGSFEGRIFEHTECGGAELLFKEHGPHIPSTGLMGTVYVLRKR